MCRRALENTKGRRFRQQKSPRTSRQREKMAFFNTKVEKLANGERDRWSTKLQVERCRRKLAHAPSSLSLWEMLPEKNDVRGGASLTF